jgi:hypothetical protein
LKQTDPYQHPRTSGNLATSGPLMDDGWMDFVAHHTGDDQVCAIEHQLFPTPFVNLKFAGEDSGAGKSQPTMWIATPSATASGTRPWTAITRLTSTAARRAPATSPVDARYLDSPGAKAMTVWYNLFAGSRHWELEPYFDVDGGRAVASRKSGYRSDKARWVTRMSSPQSNISSMWRIPVPWNCAWKTTAYDVTWINPIDGEEIKDKKGYHGEHFTGDRRRTARTIGCCTFRAKATRRAC